VDARLLAWARAAAGRPGPGRRLPKLWLFTDARRLPDPRPAAARLPPGLGAVVLRHDGEPGREALGRDLALICRARRLVLVVAGDARLAAALGAGVHLRAGRWPCHVRPARVRRGHRLNTSSAHGPADLRRAMLAGAGLVFLSPVFATASHPGAAALGPARWVRMARSARLPVAALGGIDGVSIRRLPPTICMAIGAIGALA
jgi:thiamine-phosphate pyrophosphorylase